MRLADHESHAVVAQVDDLAAGLGVPRLGLPVAAPPALARAVEVGDPIGDAADLLGDVEVPAHVLVVGEVVSEWVAHFVVVLSVGCGIIIQTLVFALLEGELLVQRGAEDVSSPRVREEVDVTVRQLLEREHRSVLLLAERNDELDVAVLVLSKVDVERCTSDSVSVEVLSDDVELHWLSFRNCVDWFIIQTLVSHTKTWLREYSAAMRSSTAASEKLSSSLMALAALAIARPQKASNEFAL